MSTETTFPLDIEIVYDALRYLTVGRVGNFLCYSFDSGEHEILDLDEDRTRRATTPIEYTLNCRSNGTKLASDAHIVFWGGPPGDCDWYTGTLLAMLVDRLFYNVAIGNHEIVERFMRAVE
jgi:hypothetical protein